MDHEKAHVLNVSFARWLDRYLIDEPVTYFNVTMHYDAEVEPYWLVEARQGGALTTRQFVCDGDKFREEGIE